MFVRSINTEIGLSTLYECRRVTTQQLDGPGDVVMFDLEYDSGCISIEAIKGVTEIYIMNDQGKTIDSYVWPKRNLETV